MKINSTEFVAKAYHSISYYLVLYIAHSYSHKKSQGIELDTIEKSTSLAKLNLYL